MQQKKKKSEVKKKKKKSSAIFSPNRYYKSEIKKTVDMNLRSTLFLTQVCFF